MYKMTTVVNRHKEDYDIYIGRGTIFGNPWTNLINSRAIWVSSVEESIRLYKEYFYDRISWDFIFRNEVLKLKDKRLGCSCKPGICHGDIIVEWINSNSKDAG